MTYTPEQMRDEARRIDTWKLKTMGNEEWYKTIAAQLRQGADAVERVAVLEVFLKRAMLHGVNGNEYYHMTKANDLGDEIKAALNLAPKEAP